MSETRKIHLAYISAICNNTIDNMNGKYAEWFANSTMFTEQFNRFMREENIMRENTDIIKSFSNYNPFDDYIPVSEPFVLIDVSFGHTTTHTKLKHLVELCNSDTEYKDNTTLFIYNMRSLGNTIEIIQQNYKMLLDANILIHVCTEYIKNDYKTENEIFFSTDTDTQTKAEYIRRIDSFDKSRIKLWKGKGTSAGFTQAFVDAFFLHQSFLISDEDAHLLSGLSKNIFANKWRKFEESPNTFLVKYAFSLEELGKVKIPEPTIEFDTYWFLMYSGLEKYMKVPYYNLPRRCGKTPDYIRYYQHAFLLDNPAEYEADTSQTPPPLSEIELQSVIDRLNIAPKDKQKNFDAVDDMIMHNIDYISVLHNKFGTELKNISPLTFRKYCLREKATHEKKYRSYLKDNIITDLSNAIQTTFKNREVTQEERDAFFLKYAIEHNLSSAD